MVMTGNTAYSKAKAQPWAGSITENVPIGKLHKW
jgi:hypothetical protein